MVRKITPILLLLAVALLCNAAFSQSNNIVSFNPNTGIANVNIPIYTMNRGGVSFPVSVAYVTRGIKVTESHNTAGMGWQLIAGGQITRDVRGLPDDNLGLLDGRFKGWLYNSNAAKIDSFHIANDNSQANCTDETADIAYINSHFGNHSDTEPDVFSVSAPGLSCEFVFDGSHQIRTIPYRDLKITYTTDLTSKIDAFTVVNDKGITYTFSLVDTVTRSAATTGPVNVDYFKTDYGLYKEPVTYNATWNLTSMYDSNGNGVSLVYTDFIPSTNAKTITLITSAPGQLNHKAFQYQLVDIHSATRRLSLVQSAKDTAKITLGWDYAPRNAESIITSVIAGGKSVGFMYSDIESVQGYKRSFLTSIGDRISTYPMQYKFDYVGYPNFIGIDTLTILPDTASKQIDYWGYYSKVQTNTSLQPSLYINPLNASYPRYKVQASATAGSDYSYSLSGAGRMADSTRAMTGTLSKITYSEGGSTRFRYELNDYYDASSGTVVRGGGIRVRSITDYDGLDSTKNIVKTYTYIDPATSASSGQPVSLPVYAFTRPYSGTGTTANLWNYSTVQSETDLSTEDESIMYSHVKVSQPGAGNILYQYTTPATLYGTNPPDWSPTVNYSARTNCATTDFTSNIAYSYPFAPNTNYDFERGLLTKVTNYNSLNQEVSETSYTYQRTDTPIAITGLRIDSNLTSRSYAKYAIYTTSAELITQQTTKVFDSPTLAQQQTSTLNYYYASTQHKLLTQQTATNSDGSIATTKITYTKDYTIPTTTDSNLVAIKSLQLLNINIPVEKQYTIQRGGTTKTYGAELTRFATFTGHTGPLYLPTQRLSFVSAGGVTDFQPFTPASGHDTRYIPAENYTAYDPYGYLLTENDNNRHIQTILSDRFVSQPQAKVTNANANEVAFADFDSNHNGIHFLRADTPTVYTTSSHTGNHALVLGSGQAVAATVHKNGQALNYIFSCWVASAATGTMTVTLNSGGTNIPYTIALDNSAGTFKYYELKMPVGSVASSFSVSFQCNIATSVDDVWLYPDNATVEAATYDITTRLKTSETTASGVTTYYSFDPYGRLLFVKDQDRQYRLKKSYVRKSDKTSFASLSFSKSYDGKGAYVGRTITFTNTTSITDPDATDIVYTWDFGDGTATATGMNSTHIYTTAGTYTVTLTATSALFGTLHTTDAVSIEALPAATVNLVYTNLTSGAAISKVVFRQGDKTVYSFKGVIIAAGATYVVPDNYTIEITVFGTSSDYQSVVYSGNTKACFAANTGLGTATYTLSDDLSLQSSAVFKIDINTCGGTSIPTN